MRLKRISSILLISIIAILISSIFSVSYAEKGSKYLNIKQKRNSGYQYAALEKRMFKIFEANSSGADLGYNKTIYCLKGGVGFGSSEFGNGEAKKQEYTEFFNMKNPSSITEPYKDAIPDITSPKYKSLLWLLDNLYVAPKDSPSSEEEQRAHEYRDKLLKAANAEAIKDEITDSKELDDLIDIIQQLAVWHFTNSVGDGYYLNANETFELYRNPVKDVEVSSFNGYRPLSDFYDWDALDAIQKNLFQYLITEAEKHNDYAPAETNRPYELEDLKIGEKIEGNNIVIGPFKIKRISDTQGTITGTFKNGETTINPTLQKADGTTYSSIEETIGEEFYISLPKETEIEKITFTMSVSYIETTVTYWSVDKDLLSANQPVVEVERGVKTYTKDAKYIPEKIDLALRKFITSVDGVAPKENREPVISPETLENLKNSETSKVTTAEKVHPKNALEVTTGSIVRYTIRVYNEGKTDAYAKEVTDYLPEGLKYIDNEFNRNNGWTKSQNDDKKITSNKLANTLIKGFDGTNLKYEDIQIECEVIATENKANNLKNIAEITIHANDKGNTVVKDRDSTPGNVDKENYGTNNQEDDDDFEQLVLVEKYIDLALRKFITSIDGVEPQKNREPVINPKTLEDLKNSETSKITTAEKVHPKNALEVKTGSIVRYTIRVYNEGENDAYAKEVTDYLPEGLKYIDNEFNRNNGWTKSQNDDKKITSNKLANTLIKGFDGTNLKYEDIQIECEVIATVQNQDNILKNIAEITIHADEKGKTTVKDRDSTPGNVDKENYGTKNQEDDDDFEQLILYGKYFDLSLRKFITAINDNELVDEDGKYIREPDVDVSPLINKENTAIYNHSKVPLNVDVADIVTYTIRVYNEGQADGYVKEITDHLPVWLEYINDEFNASYGWKISSDGRTVKTDITSPDTEYSESRDSIYADRTNNTDKVLLKAFDTSKKELDYIDVKIKCKVKDTGVAEKITNIAEITKSSDSMGGNLKDRDNENYVTLPTDEELPGYKDDKINRGDKYIPGDEDDDDFEKVILQKFDLALRKFITGVNDKEITNRIPIFSMDSNKNFTYTHPKTPVEVGNGDIVIYTIRVYNEGNQSGYAEEVKDNLPEGLVYLPDNDLNKEYRWKMYDKDGIETTDVSKAKTIKTDYLSKAQEDETGRNNLINAFNTQTMTNPDHKDVKIAFKVTEPNTSDRILINTAEISKDADEKGNPVDDIDSTPDNDKDGEDDIDIEKVKVKYFDLALEKIITEYSMKLDGKTTVTKTGHKFGVKPEPVVKIELGNKKIKTSILKFKYQIKVTNEGEIEGYAKEIKDYIPEGLKFVAKDNPKWKLSADGKTVTTDQLKDKLLKPGESAVVEITLQWINGQTNLGLKQNWAEISKDENEYNTPDIDSTPDNNKKGEDDIDDASVVLTIVTGIGENYILIIGSVLVILSAGVVLIKKFVI